VSEAVFGWAGITIAALDTATDNRWWILGVTLFGILAMIGFIVAAPMVAQRRKPRPPVAEDSVALTAVSDPEVMRPVRRTFIGLILVLAVVSGVSSGPHEHFRRFFGALLGEGCLLLAFAFLFGLMRTLPDITYQELASMKPLDQGGLGRTYFAAQLWPEFRHAGRWMLLTGGAGFLISLLLNI
jgi:hypothetical protein